MKRRENKKPGPKKPKQHNNRKAVLRSLKLESERQLIDQIRRLLSLPVEKRMNFLRVRLPGGGSAL